MNDKQNPSPKFDPRAAIILNAPKFILKLTVDMTSGKVSMETEGPDVNAMGVVDILVAQAQVIWRTMMLDPGVVKPGVSRNGDSDGAGSIPGGAAGGGNPA